MNKIAILLSTYNGEKYIEEQLESLLAQTNDEWKCYIRDDCSQDKTEVIIDRYIRHYPGKFEKIYSEKNLGPAQSFMTMLLDNEYEEKYFMFCDQDDVWKKNKISKTLEKMTEYEETVNKPILVHTDLEVVDEKLIEISGSMKKYSKLNPKYKKLENIMLQNNVTGCTVMINYSLKEKIKKSKNIVMHDWWIAMIAAVCGEIRYVDESLILYRQHNSNSIGAKDKTLSVKIKKVLNFKKSITEYRLLTSKYKKQLESLESQYYSDFDELNQKNIKLLLSEKRIDKIRLFFFTYYKAQTIFNTIIIKLMYFVFE